MKKFAALVALIVLGTPVVVFLGPIILGVSAILGFVLVCIITLEWAWACLFEKECPSWKSRF